MERKFSNNRKKRRLLYLRENATLGANSEKTFHFQNLVEANEKEKIIIQPIQYFEQTSGVHLQNYEIQENQVKLTLKNYTSKMSELRKNQKIAKIKICPESEIITNLSFPIVANAPTKTVGEKIYDSEGTEININPNLKPEQRKQALHLISRYVDLFTTDPLNVGKANVEPYEIKLKDNEPVALRAYALAPVERRALCEIANRMQEANLLSRVSSPYAAPAFAKKKDDGTYRLLCNYQKLNEKIITDKNAVPRTENIFLALEGSKYFCVLDANQGFFQIPLSEKSQEITAIILDNELFKFHVLPQGLKVSPAAFSKAIYNAFSDILYKNVVSYMDDICAYGKSFEQTLKNLEITLQRLKLLNLKLKTKNASFFMMRFNS